MITPAAVTLDAIAAHTAELCNALRGRPLDAGLCLERIAVIRTTVQRYRRNMKVSPASAAPCPPPLIAALPTLASFLVHCHNQNRADIRTLENLVANVAFCIFAWLPAPLPEETVECVRQNFCFFVYACRLQMEQLRRGAVVIFGAPDSSFFTGEVTSGGGSPSDATEAADAAVGLSQRDEYIWLVAEVFTKLDANLLFRWLREYAGDDVHADRERVEGAQLIATAGGYRSSVHQIPVTVVLAPGSDRAFVEAMQQCLMSTAVFVAVRRFEFSFACVIPADLRTENSEGSTISLDTSPLFPLASLRASNSSLPPKKELHFSVAAIHALCRLLAWGVAIAAQSYVGAFTFHEGVRLLATGVWSLFFMSLSRNRMAEAEFATVEALKELQRHVYELASALLRHKHHVSRLAAQTLRLGFLIAATDGFAHHVKAIPAISGELLGVAKAFIKTGLMLPSPFEFEEAAALALYDVFDASVCALRTSVRNANSDVQLAFQACLDLLFASKAAFYGVDMDDNAGRMSVDASDVQHPHSPNRGRTTTAAFSPTVVEGQLAFLPHSAGVLDSSGKGAEGGTLFPPYHGGRAGNEGSSATRRFTWAAAWQSAVRVTNWIKEACITIAGDDGLAGVHADASEGQKAAINAIEKKALWCLANFYATRCTEAYFQALPSAHKESIAVAVGTRLLASRAVGSVTELSQCVNPAAAAAAGNNAWVDYASWRRAHQATVQPTSVGLELNSNTPNDEASVRRAKHQWVRQVAHFVELRIANTAQPSGHLAGCLRFFDELIARCLEDRDPLSAAGYCESMAGVLSNSSLPPIVCAHLMASAARLYASSSPDHVEDSLRLGMNAVSALKVSACDLPYAMWLTGLLVQETNWSRKRGV
mgnify:CR=1 FL=1